MAVERCAQILNGVVENVVMADPAVFVPTDGSTLVPSSGAGPGYTYANGVFTPAATVYATQNLDFYYFLGLFTPAEFSAIVSSGLAPVKVFLMTYIPAPSFNLTDTAIVNAINFLVAQSLLTSGRGAQILTGAPHP